MDNEDYDSTHDKLDRIEEKLENLESEVSHIKNNMLTWGILVWIFLGFIFALWGDKIWEFVKGAFFLVLGLGFGVYESVRKFGETTSLATQLSVLFFSIIIIWVIVALIKVRRQRK